MPSRVSDSITNNDQSINLHHKHLDLNSVKELPESHVWTSSLDELNTNASVSVPVIDLNDQNAQELIGHACKTWGVFQVTNHGVESGLLQDIESAARKLFALPLQQKLKAARSDGGLTGYGVARISPFFPKFMWSEGFTISGSPLEHARSLWPKDYHSFCDVIGKYEKAMQELANRLLWLMLESLDIAKEDVQWACREDDQKSSNGFLQLNSYPICPEPDRAMGLGAHTDSTVLTILYQNDTSGLQVHQEATGWVTVQPLPGALVVNIGDLLHILSNGLYPSVLHRVVVNKSKHRLTAAYFYGPPSNVEVAPLSKLVDLNHPPLFRSIGWKEYLDIKAECFNNALSYIRT